MKLTYIFSTINGVNISLVGLVSCGLGGRLGVNPIVTTLFGVSSTLYFTIMARRKMKMKRGKYYGQ